MPRLSGPELAQQLRAMRPGLEVLFMSGYNDSRLVHRGVEEANVNLLVKPFSPDELVKRVAELTARESRRRRPARLAQRLVGLTSSRWATRW